MNRKGNKQTARTNWPITILLIIGCLTIFFPLYMTIIIAFKQPSEMTNDIAGALAFQAPGVSATLLRLWKLPISGTLWQTVC